MTHRLPPPRWLQFATAIRAVFLWAGEWIIIGAMFFGLALIIVFAGFFFEALGQEPGRCGLASWYGQAHHGNRTASGERFDMHALTAAHRGLAFGTVVRVTRQDTGAAVLVRINDFGPAARTGRIIDLSLGAAEALGMVRAGVVPVCIDVRSVPA